MLLEMPLQTWDRFFRGSASQSFRVECEVPTLLIEVGMYTPNERRQFLFTDGFDSNIRAVVARH